MPDDYQPRQRIAIVGGGFSGTSLIAAIQRECKHSIEIILCEKTGCFGPGEAYKTPLPYHLLNVRACDMSIYADEPAHFATWLMQQKNLLEELGIELPVEKQFLPRMLYGKYLQQILQSITQDPSSLIKLSFVPEQVLDIVSRTDSLELKFANHYPLQVDQVVLALGNGQPDTFPFSVDNNVQCINNPWDYTAVNAIPSHDTVLIVGTGLSMIDTVLTLHHQQHHGKIIALSRHGLLPLPHAEIQPLHISSELPTNVRSMTTYLRKMSRNHDWRSMITALRAHVPELWQGWHISCQKRFLRHVLPYWNIHRHRVHQALSDLLQDLIASQQLTVMAGRIQRVKNGNAYIKPRHSEKIAEISVNWLINCMGPSLSMSGQTQPLISSLLKQGVATFDALKLGFAVSESGALQDKDGNISTQFFTLGPPAKGKIWEATAVPEIRLHSKRLAQHLLNHH